MTLSSALRGGVLPTLDPSREADLEAEVVALISKDAVKIPPYPVVAMEIAAMLREGDYGIDDIVKLVASDQSLSASVLRMASSAAFGPEPVSSVRGAVARLGIRQVSVLALAAGLGAQVKENGPLAPLKRRIWQESLTSAHLCQKLAPPRGESSEEAFTCGLLHDFGRVVAVSTLEQILKTKTAAPPQPEAFWNKVVERFHLELGLILSARWRLSQLLRDVITLHHGDTAEACERPQILDAVMAADAVIALSHQLPAVTAEDLLAVPRLRSAAERDLIARTLPSCPNVVASFEAESQPSAVAKTAIAPLRSGAKLKPISLEVVDLTRPKVTLRATAIGPNVLVLRTSQPLPLNRLVQLSLQVPDHAFTIWANPEICEPDGSGQRVELKPFALGGDSLRQWVDLARS
jgi:HD-like signal output (HDOD) protein